MIYRIIHLYIDVDSRDGKITEARRNFSDPFVFLGIKCTRLFFFLFFFSFLIFAKRSRWERNSFDRNDNAIFARMPPRPTTGRSCEEMHRADYLEPRKWNTVISVSRERNPISLLRRGFVRIPRNKGRCLLSLSHSRSEIAERKGTEAGDNSLNLYNL